MTENLRLAVAHPNHTMNKVKNMRTLYVKAVDWKANTGQGVESGTIDGNNTIAKKDYQRLIF